MHGPRAQRLAGVALDPGGRRVAAPVGLETLEVEPEALDERPQVRIVLAALGGFLVTFFKPNPPRPSKAPSAVVAPAAVPAAPDAKH